MPRATTGATVPPKAKLAGLEALRGVAATGVVIYHVARHLDLAFAAPGLRRWFQAGHAGVDLFFVLSGFVILLVHRQDLGRPGKVGHYCGRRFSRVAPPYWIALAATMLLAGLARHGWPGPWAAVANAVLLPPPDDLLLGVAWTLQYEVVFYAIFAVLILHRGCGLALLALWLTATALGMADAHSSWRQDPIGGIYGSEFFMGMLAAWLAGGPVARPRSLAIIGAAAFATAGLLESMGVLDGYGALARLAYGLPAAALILGVVAAERADLGRAPRWLAALGSASYAIYLWQFLFIGVAWKTGQTLGLQRQAPVLAWFAVLVAAALAGGILVSATIERPLLRVIRPRRA